MKDNIHHAWMVTVLGAVLVMALVAVMITFHDWSYTLNINMDNNTREAIQSINYTAINDVKEVSCPIPLYVLQSNQTYKIIVYNNVCNFALDKLNEKESK